MKNIYILGAAGSIGLQALDIIEKNHEDFNLIGVSLGSDEKINHEILNRFSLEIVSLRYENQLEDYQLKYPSIKFVYGDQGLIDVSIYPVKGVLVNALSGSAGLRPTIEAIQSGKDIALANKETLVMAGDYINELLDTYRVKLYPIDSEHSALWQTMDGEDLVNIDKIVITASGGTFRDSKREDLLNVSLDEALKHPNWSMGAKITIDSATMMNKGLEVIEAHHLFHLPYEKIETILHRESVVHGLTYFTDGTIKASLSVSDMRIPILYALYYPKRANFDKKLNLTDLSFKPMDFERFPLLKLAYQVGNQGGLLPTVMNAANEAAVKLFIQNKIKFLEIENIVMQYVENFKNVLNPTIDEIIDIDRLIQKDILLAYEKR